MDSTKLKAIFITVIVGIFALWLGLNAATAQIETVMWVVSVGTILTCAMLGRKVWMVLPFMAGLNISLNIPGQPSTLLIGQALVVGFSGLLILLRKLPIKIKFTELEWWVTVMVIFALQAYLRNPVGLSIFGSGSVGAKPYALFVSALAACIVFSMIKIPATDLRWFIRISIFAGILNFMFMAIGHFIPRIGMWYGAVLNTQNESIAAQNRAQYGVESAGRVSFVRDIGRNLALWTSSFKSPIRACFHPIWAPLVIISLICAAYSGYRNEIAAVGFTYIVGIAYREGLPALFIAFGGGIALIAVLALVNLATPLHPNIQRSLSFLPGTWDSKYVEDAEASTDWRVDMWKDALLTDHWIQNKWLGDGLGMTQKELQYITSLSENRLYHQTSQRGITYQQEVMMAAGDYHSGPVSTIRAIGYVGLFFLVFAQIRLAVHAHRQIKRARYTRWQPLAMLVGIPLIWSPAFFVFIVGSFGTAISQLLLGVAWIRLLENNMSDHAPEENQHNRPEQTGNI